MKKNEFGNRANIVRLNGIRVAPRKLRVLVDMIRHMSVHEAIVVLQYSDRRAAKPLANLLLSAVSNIRNEIQDWDVDDLVVAEARVDEGPTMRRFRPRARGMASRINKRTSKVTVEVRPADL